MKLIVNYKTELRVWNDIYYLHTCPRMGYADVSEYFLDKEYFYNCVHFCGFKFPSIICSKPLPLIKGYLTIYGHKTISCSIKKREVYNL